MVTVDGQKMGKSLGNFITLKQVFVGDHERLTRAYEPLAVRQLVLNSHYRSPLDFSDAALFAAHSGHQKIVETIKNLRRHLKTAPDGPPSDTANKHLGEYKAKFEDAMNDDLNTSVALSVIFRLVNIATDLMNYRGPDKVTKGTFSAIDDFFQRFGGDVLGIVQQEYEEQTTASDIQRYELAIGGMIELRNKARREKNFPLADEIRGILGSVGIVIEDRPDGTEWRLG